MRSKNSAVNSEKSEKGRTWSLSAAEEREEGKQKQGYSFWTNLKEYKTIRIQKINTKPKKGSLGMHRLLSLPIISFLVIFI